MNEEQFKRHLRDLVHGHHHPEEHDWDQQPQTAKKAAAARSAPVKRRTIKKTSRRK